MAKVTRATLKSFIKKNLGNLYIKVNSKFNGMVDCVMPLDDSEYRVAKISLNDFVAPPANTLGIDGAWFVGGSRDYFTKIENESFEGYEVYNCVGSFELVVKK